MSEDAGHEDRPSPRGEAAWKAATQRIAERNQAARKAGKARRGAYERQRDAARRAAEREIDASLVAKRTH